MAWTCSDLNCYWCHPPLSPSTGSGTEKPNSLSVSLSAIANVTLTCQCGLLTLINPIAKRTSGEALGITFAKVGGECYTVDGQTWVHNWNVTLLTSSPKAST